MKHFNFNSLSFRMGIYIGAIAALLYIIFGSIFYAYTSRVIINDATDKSTILLNSVSLEIEIGLHVAEKNVKNCGYTIGVNIDEPSRYKLILSKMVNSSPIITHGAIIFNPRHASNPNCYYTDSDTLFTFEQNALKRIAEYDRLKAFKSQWHRSSKNTPHNTLVTYIQPIIESNGDTIAYLKSSIALDWVTKLIGSRKPYNYTSSVLISQDSEVLCHQYRDDISKYISTSLGNDNNSFFVKHLKDEIPLLQKGERQLDIHGTEYLMFFSSVKPLDWTIATITPKDDLYQPIQELKQTTRSVAAGMIVVIFILIMWFTRRTLAPLVELSKSTELIAQGNFDVPLPTIRSNNEIYSLTEAFKRMERSLKEYIEQQRIQAQQQERAKNELDIASRIQKSMLPTPYAKQTQHEALDLYADIILAQKVGGDLYYYTIKGDKLYVAVGDVSGKGVPASMIMTVITSFLELMSNYDEAPGDALHIINEQSVLGNSEMIFTTLFFASLNLKTGQLSYANAGHPAPVIAHRRSTQRLIELPAPALPIGIKSGTHYETRTAQLLPGDLLMLYTDGVTDALNAQHEPYAEERLLTDNTFGTIDTAQGCVEQLIQSINGHIDGHSQFDDIALVAFRWNPINQERSTFTLENDLKALAVLKPHIDHWATTHAWKEETVRQINLVLEEMLTNCILYAYPEKQGIITVEVTTTPNHFIATIEDTGTPFDPTQASNKPLFAPKGEIQPIGGLGIHLTRQILDKMIYQHIGERNQLTLIKLINTK